MWLLNKIIKKRDKFLKQTRKLKIILVRNKYFFLNSMFSKRIIVFFVPTDIESISGGVLSITSILKETKHLRKIHNCNVYASFLPGVVGEYYKYNKFESDLVIFDFEQITNKFKKLEYLELQIPDIFIFFFNKNNIDCKILFDWITNVENVKINLMNQNEVLMPNLEIINNLRQITNNITMTVAHENYATQEKRNFYGLPIHLYSPWTSPTPYEFLEFDKKENIIVVSPDLIDQKIYLTKITKEEILIKLKNELPEFEIVIIQNMSYINYKNIISKAKFAITFGEGLDGYFCEPIFSGSISFAVYNNIFFKTDFYELKTIYSSFEDLYFRIVDDIKLLNSNNNFKNYNTELNNKISKIYSLDRLKNNIKSYYLNILDFP